MTDTQTKRQAGRLRTVDLAQTALFSALIAVCSWISIPTTVPFTLQTFGVFVAVGVLGGKRGTLSVLIYILMGLVGLPVFAGFRGGAGVLLGTTGGYIVGFLFSALALWGLERTGLLRSTAGSILAMLLGLGICYAFGTLWFWIVYAHSVGAVGLGAILSWCVLPFIFPDLVKIAAACILTRRLRQSLPTV